MITAAIVGGTGYTGVELIRLLSQHPKVTIKYLTSRTEAGRYAYEIFPSLRGICELQYTDLTVDKLAECDVVFFATPHGVAMKYAPELVTTGTKIIDLAADFRLQSIQDFEYWYKQPHQCPQLLKNAIYGLPEITRQHLKEADIVGNPGCYPTTAILGLKPIIEIQNTQQHPCIEKHIIIDAKSGVSGAGRKSDVAFSYAETTDNFKAYGVAGHRHLAEIEQGVQTLLSSKFHHQIRFLPHLVPMIRGMFTSIHLVLTEQGTLIDWQHEFEKCYQNEAFIDILPEESYPDTRSVRASNRLKIAIHQNNERSELTVLVVQDNLVKGASGQAVQSMNCLFGFEETLGLMHFPIVP